MNKKSQFAHVETYSQKGLNNSQTKKSSCFDVIMEALRKAGFFNHLLDGGYTAQEPNILYSDSDKNLLDRMDDFIKQLETEKDSQGRKISAIQNILMAGVFSYPKPVNTKDGWTEDDKQNYLLFKETSIDFLKNEYGDNLVCVLEHQDEEFPHLHYYVVNKKKISALNELHPGHSAVLKEQQKLETELAPTAKMKLYKNAMKSWQDRFFAQVGIYCGFDRLGPKKQRLSRSEWKIRKQQMKAVQSAIKVIKKKASEVKEKSDSLDDAIIELESKFQDLETTQVAMEKESTALELEKTRLEKLAKELNSKQFDADLIQYIKENHSDIFMKFKIDKVRSSLPNNKKDFKNG